MSTFSPVRRVRSFDDVTKQIRDAILSGEIGRGERLPSERVLCETFGVSRSSLREALRSLETLGIVEIRPGKGGGAYAATPPVETVGNALATLVSLQGASAQDLAEFRVSFEGENAWWAARRADGDDVATLEGLVKEARAALRMTHDGIAALGEVDARWHEALALATGNRLRVAISLGLHEAVLRQVPALEPAGERYARTIPSALAKITKAIVARDGDAARDAMRTHVEQWARLNPDVTIGPPSRPARSSSAPRAGR
jgi:GntR family transcriptional regulator, transcriptional repressor for pyruvate dehydrogenase complex